MRPGEADACVVCVPGTGLGIATSVDGNPRYSSIDAYLGAVHAVVRERAQRGGRRRGSRSR